MKYILDTNTIIAVMKNNAAVWDHLRSHRRTDCALSSVVTHELYFGAYKSERIAENLDRLSRLRFPVIDLNQDDAREAGRIRAHLGKAGTPIGPYDILIAGQALSRSLIVVTRNVDEFMRVPDLTVENWQE